MVVPVDIRVPYEVYSMKIIRRFLKHILTVDEGVTAVEYAVMLAMIIVAAIGAILNAGNVQKALWFDTADSMTEITPTGTEL